MGSVDNVVLNELIKQSFTVLSFVSIFFWRLVTVSVTFLVKCSLYISILFVYNLKYRKEVGLTKFIPKAVLENMKVRLCPTDKV